MRLHHIARGGILTGLPRSTFPSSGLPVVRRAGGGGGMVAVPGAGSGPDQQDGAGGVIDDEPTGRAEAFRAQPGAVAVAGHDQQASAVGGGDDLMLDPPGPLQPGAGTPQALGGGLQELLGGAGGQSLQPGAGVALAVAAAQQTRIGAVPDGRDVAAGDVQQDDIGSVGRPAAGGVDTGRPGAFDDPGDHFHGVSLPGHAATPTVPAPPG